MSCVSLSFGGETRPLDSFSLQCVQFSVLPKLYGVWMSDVLGQYCQIRVKKLPKISGTKHNNQGISLHAAFYGWLHLKCQKLILVHCWYFNPVPILKQCGCPLPGNSAPLQELGAYVIFWWGF